MNIPVWALLVGPILLIAVIGLFFLWVHGASKGWWNIK